jgi:hypothetical protein
MDVHLTEEEASRLRDLLRDYLPELRMEVARTEAKDFRHMLVQRQELCERILEQLERGGLGNV